MDSALHDAARQGNVAMLKKLIAERPDILCSSTPQENTALHIAAELGHADFAMEALRVDYMLLFRKNAYGDTPLHLAARAGKAFMVELLISWSKYSPVTGQCSPGSPFTANKAGDTPLHEAVKHRRNAVALKLFFAEPCHGYALNVKMMSPLHIAAREGLSDVVVTILSLPWVHERYVPHDNVNGTALHQAAISGRTRVVEILLDATWDVDIGLTDPMDNTVLHYAAEKNNARVLKMLLNRKWDLAYRRNRDLQSPLHVAAKHGSTEAVKEMLTRFPDVEEMVDEYGWNALHFAIFSDKVDVLRCLLKYVSSEDIINRAGRQGDTPLHLAARYRRAALGMLLLKDRRVNPCVLNWNGSTARSMTERQTSAESLTVYFWKELKKQESIKCKAQLLPADDTPPWLPDFNQYVQQRMGTYTVVATLIATVTFSSTFPMPGGYDQQDGTALLGHRMAFKLFIIANTLAMLTSIVVVFGFIWARREQLDFRASQVEWSHWLTVIACLSMVVSLTTSVYLTVAAKSPWLAYMVIAMGSSTPVLMFLMLGKDLFSTRL